MEFKSANKKIIALSTEIGRGHPNYLSSVIQALKTVYPNQEIEYYNIFEISALNGLARVSWSWVKKLYFLGGYGGIFTKLYNLIREKSTRPNPIFLRLLSSGLDIFLKGFTGIILVEHPLLAKVLTNLGFSVFYIHGEIAAPKECALFNNALTFVPLDATKQQLVKLGVKSESIIVTGLVVEPDLVRDAKENFALRVARLSSQQPLTVAFFISQAYPKPHIEKIITAVESVVKNGMRAIVFTGTLSNYAFHFKNRLESIRNCYSNKNIMIVQSRNRQEENEKTVCLAHKIDIMIAAAHERTNWAIGLGLPMFVPFPLIGTYAKLNYNFAQNLSVAEPILTIEDARNLGAKLIVMQKNNSLSQMAKNGFFVYPLTGARTIADYLIKLL